MNKKVGIIGSGTVGQSLAKGFLAHGFDVLIGSNHSNKHSELRSTLGGKASVGTFEEAAGHADLVVLAVKGSAAESAVKALGASRLSGKTVIDATNPIAEAPPVNGVIQFFTSPNDSLMERLQKLAPGAKFVKAFNSVGSAFMVDPQFGGMKPTMFICGNQDTAKAEVAAILVEFGWEVEDMGKQEAARAIEPLSMLWCIPGFLRNSWSHAFRLLKA